MINKHITFLPNKLNKKMFFLDLTFGLGGYILSKNFFKLIAIDKNLFSIYLSRNKYKKNFFIFNIKIKKIFFILKRFNIFNINVLIYDQGFNSCEIKNFFYKLKINYYKEKKFLINKNFLFIFNKLIYFFKKNFFFIINIFDNYNLKKFFLFIKIINKFKIKIIKLNFFEISLNNSFKNSKMIIVYV
ncbi:S-adenosyl-methyltransferase MraW [Candidatus Carsonella ruddii]|uniref:Putative S-adenosyl-methyltransferase MraW n=1 Tax=Candidatus Carsonella ruddii HC isolate Thao2000 TaxID=1202538 RepID=J3Z125_CARRU|nr:S-adenosyl-methyltransferase MraW [Candidatus Carsonella ruddii]AFP83909.1 putative S-adenosyl-methyltransferase MraW [Candidatus Carsonella ruddii HC isolate Thao2000]